MLEHNIVPKTIEKVLEEFDELYADEWWELDGDEKNDWLRSAMQSLLEQAIEEMPEPKPIMIFERKLTDGGGYPSKEAIVYNNAINDCITAIKSLQKRI